MFLIIPGMLYYDKKALQVLLKQDVYLIEDSEMFTVFDISKSYKVGSYSIDRVKYNRTCMNEYFNYLIHNNINAYYITDSQKFYSSSKFVESVRSNTCYSYNPLDRVISKVWKGVIYLQPRNFILDSLDISILNCRRLTPIYIITVLRNSTNLLLSQQISLIVRNYLRHGLV